jgi:hypothetical protein
MTIMSARSTGMILWNSESATVSGPGEVCAHTPQFNIGGSLGYPLFDGSCPSFRRLRAYNAPVPASEEVTGATGAKLVDDGSGLGPAIQEINYRIRYPRQAELQGKRLVKPLCAT